MHYFKSANEESHRYNVRLILAAVVTALIILVVMGFSTQNSFADSSEVSKVILNNNGHKTTYLVKTSRDSEGIKDGIEDYLINKDDNLMDVSFDKNDSVEVTPLKGERFAGADVIGNDKVYSFNNFCKKVLDEKAITVTTVTHDEDVIDTIPYDTVNKTSSAMRKGTKKVTGGVDGKVCKNYKVVSTDGKVVKREYVDTTTTKAKDKVVTVGTGSVNAVGRTVEGTTGKEVVKYAKKFVGNPYVYGGTSLTNGADCSGFIYSVYRHFGINVPRIPYSAGKAVSLSDLQPGDIIIYSGHFAMYAGNGQVVHAINYRYGIRVTSMYFAKTPRSARRVVTDAE